MLGIGLDLGSTAVKAQLIGSGRQGASQGASQSASQRVSQVRAAHACEAPLQHPEAGAAVQDLTFVKQAAITVLRHMASAGKPDFMGISAAMHSAILLDAQGAPLTPAHTWADTRAASQAAALKREAPGIYARTGVPIHPMSVLPKLMWWRAARPALHARAAKCVSVKEWLFHWLTGQWVCDESVASATALWNCHRRQYDDEALSTAGWSTAKLNPLVPTTHVGKLTREAASATGLAEGLPIVVGATDGVLANLGSGALPGRGVALTVGTSGAVRETRRAPTLDHAGRTFCYVLDRDHWVVGGSVNSGGMVLRWARDTIARDIAQAARAAGEDPYLRMADAIASVPPGADGLRFYPYLAGERAPLWDASATGSFVGLTVRHTQAHLLRAVAEGMVFNLKSVFDLLGEALLDGAGDVAGSNAGGQRGGGLRETVVDGFGGGLGHDSRGELSSNSVPEKRADATRAIKASGGLFRSQVMRQLVADVFAMPVDALAEAESSCLGAVMLGQVALGHAATLADTLAMVPEAERTLPNNSTEDQTHYAAWRAGMPIAP
jgi:gluconokinase